MTSTKLSRVCTRLLFAAIVGGLISGARTFAQTTPAADAVAEVRKTVDAARKEIAAYKTAGGLPGAADHPAVKWDATLWAYRGRYPGSEAATIASTEAIRLLIRAELWDRAHARVDALDAHDPAWERLPSAIYEGGVARKDLSYTIAKLSGVAAATTNARSKSAALVALGRAYRRQGDNEAAVKALEGAKAAAPGTPSAEEAEGLLYEVKYLAIGLPAPALSGSARNGSPVSLTAFRGKAVVLVFWGTT